MARYTGPVCRLCRREGLKLYLKGDRCNTGKCSVVKREKAGAPGQHGTTRKKQSEYGAQLREKQKAKRIYGVLEKQFRNYFTAAERMKGVTGENLLRLLELRLDNVVYRLGYGRSRAEARQVVLQGHIKVNGRKVNIASYRVKQGDKLEVKEKSVGLDRFKLIIDGTDFRIVPEWLNADHQNLKGEVLSLPTRDQIKEPIEETYIVELYSK